MGLLVLPGSPREQHQRDVVGISFRGRATVYLSIGIGGGGRRLASPPLSNVLCCWSIASGVAGYRQSSGRCRNITSEVAEHHRSLGLGEAHLWGRYSVII